MHADLMHAASPRFGLNQEAVLFYLKFPEISDRRKSSGAHAVHFTALASGGRFFREVVLHLPGVLARAGLGECPINFLKLMALKHVTDLLVVFLILTKEQDARGVLVEAVVQGEVGIWIAFAKLGMQKPICVWAPFVEGGLRGNSCGLIHDH